MISWKRKFSSLDSLYPSLSAITVLYLVDKSNRECIVINDDSLNHPSTKPINVATVELQGTQMDALVKIHLANSENLITQGMNWW